MQPQTESTSNRISEIRDLIRKGKPEKALNNSAELFDELKEKTWADKIALLQSRFSSLQARDLSGTEENYTAKLNQINEAHLSILSLYVQCIENPERRAEIEQHLASITLPNPFPQQKSKPFIWGLIAISLAVIAGLWYWLQTSNAPLVNDVEQIIEMQRDELKDIHRFFEQKFELGMETVNTVKLHERTRQVVEKLDPIETTATDDYHNLLKEETLSKAYFMLSLMEDNAKKKEDFAVKSIYHCDMAEAFVNNIQNRENPPSAIINLRTWISDYNYLDRIYSTRLISMAIIRADYFTNQELRIVYDKINGTFFEDELYGLYEPIQQLVRDSIIPIELPLTD